MPTADCKDTTDAWQEVVALTQTMMDSVRAGEIERMVELEGRRHRLLAVVFSAAASRPSATEIQQVMSMDAEIIRRAAGYPVQQSQGGGGLWPYHSCVYRSSIWRCHLVCIHHLSLHCVVCICRDSNHKYFQEVSVVG